MHTMHPETVTLLVTEKFPNVEILQTLDKTSVVLTVNTDKCTISGMQSLLMDAFVENFMDGVEKACHHVLNK